LIADWEACSGLRFSINDQKSTISNDWRLQARFRSGSVFLPLRPRGTIMDIVQAFVLDLGWIFFIAWGTVLAAVGAIAFGRDLFPSTSRPRYEPEPLSLHGD
jgi:hypothetical protein